MRALLVLVLLGGCGSASLRGGASRPAVMPMLSELPNDAAKRDAVLDAASTAAGEQQRTTLTPKERKAETAAATAAAILGSMFSKTKSVTIGTASTFDESELGAPSAIPAQQPSSTDNPEGAANPGAPPADDAGASNADLIPWIRLK
jgi:hypothetical protein